MKYIFVPTFILVHILFGKEWGYTVSSPLHTHFTYMFVHAGAVHLAINTMAFIGMFRALENLHVCKGWILALSVIMCGFAASLPPPVRFDTPTVGSSSMVYAMIGIYLVWIRRCKTVRITNRTNFITFIACICISLAISYFKPGSNFPLHLLSLLTGGIVAFVWSFLQGR
jgi:membrane associated rhomboid family serine protease